MESISYQKKKNYSLRTMSYQLKMLMLILLSISILSCDSSTNGPIGEGFYWERTSGPSNAACSLAVARNGDIWVSAGSEIYLSTDNGNTWIQKGSFVHTIEPIVVNPINGYIFAGSTVHGLLRSTDNGESWVQITNNMHVFDIVIAPSGEIYFGTGGSIQYSSNNGNTWITKSNGLPLQAVVSLALENDGTLYAGIDNLGTDLSGVYRSTDGGGNWLPCDANEYFIDITVSDDGSIFAATLGSKVLRSVNRGVNWDQINTGLDGWGTRAIIYNPITMCIFVSVAISFDDSKIYRSTNFGANWELKSDGIQNRTSHIHSFAFNFNTGQMFAATDGGVYRSRNYPN